MTNPFGLYGANGAYNINPYEYPDGATPTSNSSGNVANGVATATLPAMVGKTNYLTGFAVTGSGATAASVVTVTINGIVGGTMSFTVAVAAGATVGNTPLIVAFPFPIPATATNTNITVFCPALGAGNTNSTVSAYGYVK